MTSSSDQTTPMRVVTNRLATRSIAPAGKNQAKVLVFPVPRSDVGLIQGLRAGRIEAVQALCDRYGAELLRVAMRVLGPEELLNEVVSGGVSRAIARLPQLENPQELRHWLLRHVVEVVGQRLRALRWRRRWSRLMGLGSVPVGRSLVEPYDVSERQRQAYRLLGRMGDAERIVLCLTRLDGMEPSEVATVLGSSVARVRRLLERAEIGFERLSAP